MLNVDLNNGEKSNVNNKTGLSDSAIGDPIDVKDHVGGPPNGLLEDSNIPAPNNGVPVLSDDLRMTEENRENRLCFLTCRGTP